MTEFICYPKCSTCARARKWLDEHDIEYSERNIKEAPPTADELRTVAQLAGVPVRKLFNTSGMLYREYGLKDKLGSMSDEEMLSLLASDGMLVKRPIIKTEKTAASGFREKEWSEKLLG